MSKIFSLDSSVHRIVFCPSFLLFLKLVYVAANLNIFRRLTKLFEALFCRKLPFVTLFKVKNSALSEIISKFAPKQEKQLQINI